MEALKANELRCGNLVTVNNPEYHPAITGQIMVVVGVESWRNPESIDLIFQDKRKNMTNPCASQWIEFIEGIQITEDWLMRGVFEKFRHIKDGIVFDNSWLRINESMVAYWRGGYIGKIKYVHTLQNIIFDLTGTELQFKPIK